ncbi:peptidoglycan DD-metalloendopeptidase family protein [Luminiphilus sp.]|nr:peptidoglycan DD-metalloendopeptidase family protein [Luminiphilus sp.]MDA7840195.1 peptidoglycan DD-metalloendopeptidase family protein [Luminiphilus sp.]MDB3923569.1 peptidoglycan DD-metalloendopeptidase family protein [Luminiphilus sp.]
MKLIFVHRTAASRTLEIGRWSWAALSVICIGLPLGLMAMGYELGQRQGASIAQEARLSEAELNASRRAGDLAQLSADARRKLEAMTRKLAELQVRVTRLDALGTHLTALAGLEGGEFNFAAEPALGGPMMPLLPESQTSLPAPLKDSFDGLSVALSDREMQLDILAGLLFDAEAQTEAIPAGRPVLSGWLSSAYGSRTDPFTGKRAWHQGIDFAGAEGDHIIAVASGVVSWSGERTGYGTLVEIAHGDGLITRYAHNRENRVEVGDLVRQGDVIALMGNSGRSTGPHVHFEIFKHGRAVDPSSYVRRTLR